MQSIGLPVQQTEAGWFNRRERQVYLGIGKNTVTAIADRFGLTCVDGCFDEPDVWRRLLDLEPVHDHGIHLLRMPLRDIHWVGAQPGEAASTTRNEISRGAFPFGSGVQLGALAADGGPRLRRWCAPVFDAERRGIAIAAGREASSLVVVEDDVGLLPLDDFAGLLPAEVVTMAPPIRTSRCFSRVRGVMRGVSRCARRWRFSWVERAVARTSSVRSSCVASARSISSCLPMTLPSEV
jgi:hypothetical protein